MIAPDPAGGYAVRGGRFAMRRPEFAAVFAGLAFETDAAGVGERRATGE